MKKITKKNDFNPVCKGVIWLPVNIIVAAKYGTSRKLFNVIVHASVSSL